MWTFWGDGFSWIRTDEGEATIDINAKWHEPLVDPIQQYPALEVDEALSLKNLGLTVRLLSGGSPAALSEVRSHYRAIGREFDEAEIPEFFTTIFVLDDRISVCSYLDKTHLDSLLFDFLNFGAISSPKHFWGRFSTRILVGDQSIGVQPEEKKEFLRGELPGQIETKIGLSFTSGQALPSRSDNLSTLERMRRFYS